MLRCLLSLTVLAVAAAAQPAAFEVASIKPSSGSGNAKTIHVDPGMVTIRAMSLKDLMLRAYGRGHALQLSRSDMVAGPAKWYEDDLYDIDAKPGGNPLGTGEDISNMLQALLAERFHLTWHHEQKQVPGYLLTLSLEGKMTQRRPNGTGATRTGIGRRIPGGYRLTRRDTTMAALADFLGFSVLDRPVVDKTGLQGTFDFDLEWTPDETEFGGRFAAIAATATLPSLFTALRDRLGLKLEPGKATVDVFVIDQARKPAAN